MTQEALTLDGVVDRPGDAGPDLFSAKVLLYHDITQGGRVTPADAGRRFGAQLDWLRARGFRFAGIEDLLAGRLGPRDVVVTFDDALRSFIDIALPALEQRAAPAVLFAVSQFSGRPDADGVFLDWDELHACAARGVHIACHARTHVPLDEVPPERMHDEITEATARFAEEGFAAVAFAYPFGRYDDAVKAALVAEGYGIAFTVMKGGADRLEVRRRLLTGSEGPAALRLLLSERFFETRDRVRRMVPRRFLKQEQPIAPARWGAHGFGLPDIED